MRYLTPYGFATLEEVLEYVGRQQAGKQIERDAAVDAANAAVGWMEARTARALAVRSYRWAVAVAGCGTTLDDASLTVGNSAFFYLNDDLVGAGLQPGTRVVGLPDSTHVTIEPKASATGTATVTAGGTPLQLDGDGGNELYIGQWPLAQLISAKARHTDDSLEAIDTTGYRLERSQGFLWLPRASFPRGRLNIEIECRAGYVQPLGTALGHWAEWEDLKRIQMRAAQVFFQDWASKAARTVSVTIQPMTHTLPGFKMPDDIEQAISKYARAAA